VLLKIFEKIEPFSKKRVAFFLKEYGRKNTEDGRPKKKTTRNLESRTLNFK
jgi:hypothetical protein